MNKAISEGLVLMPVPFSAGLNQWSRENGTPGSASYAGQANAAFVPSDQDFGGCLELEKTETTQKLRYMGETPLQPGLYLRVTTRIKAVAGNLPAVRIAAWAGRANGSNVADVPQAASSVTLTSYGKVIEISAIIGSGDRRGVDMVWGVEPTFAHIGLDLTGANGGVVRIDNFVVEDITSAFIEDRLNSVDVRDYGAVGNGVTNDSAAFQAADTAAQGRTVIVSKGVYRLTSNVTFNNRVLFQGTLSMPSNVRLACTRNYDLDTYTSAFGSELEGFRRGLQALFYYSDHVTFDLSGRTVNLTEPINVAALAGLSSFSQRRLISNGQLNAASSSSWNDSTSSSVATYSTNAPDRLTNVANVANIAVGSLVTGTGVGREVYVKDKNVGAGTITLSQPLWAAAGTRTYGFRRFKYMLDFSGFDNLARFEITDVEFQCNGRASGINLATAGLIFRVADCVFSAPAARGITSTGAGCAGMIVDQCQFLSNEQAMPSQDRTTIALNANVNDCKIRDNRIVRFAHFAVLAGTGCLILGNHFFQGDDQTDGVRMAGLVMTQTNCKHVIANNYIDNCFIEWSNEHDPEPGQNNEFSFGALTVSGNLFFASNIAPSFRFLVIKPRGPGHFINGLSVTGNIFRLASGTVDRVEKVDTSNANLDFSKTRNLLFEANTYNAVTQMTISPVMISHTQNSAAATWLIDGGAYMPFNGWARNVQSIVVEGEPKTASNAGRADMPYVEVEQGDSKDKINLKWPVAVRGKAHVTLRCDNPL